MTNQPGLLIRADASIAMGTGHVMRCLALAQAWQDAGGHVAFAMASPPPLVRERLLKESFRVLEISAAAGSADDVHQTAILTREDDASWVVVDGYQFGADYQRNLKAEDTKILFLDDCGHAGHYSADIVLNQNISANESAYQNREPYTRLLLGPQYCLLRREFTARQQRTRKIAPVARRVLVTMGGSDPEDFTPVALHTLSLIDDELEAAVVVGGSKSKPELANAIAAIRGKKITLHRDVSNMAELMAWADVAISAAGITTWELCLMGLPALLISVAENQTPVAHNLSARGCAIYLGKTKDISVKKIAEQLQFLLQSSERRQLMSSRCRELVDGRGATRVVDALRCATFPGDAQR